MKKTIKRILAMTSLTVLITLTGVATIILFPQPLFAHKMTYNEFTVYANDEITNDIKPILDNAMQRITKSELHDPDYTYDIFLSYNTPFNKIDDKILGFGPSARATDNNITIKVQIDIANDLFFPTFHSACQGSLTSLLTHEMIHCLQANKYGIITFNPFNPPPMWKLEGYPEYIARQPQRETKTYSLTHEIDRYIALDRTTPDNWIQIQDGGCHAPKYYYKGRLLIEYLMNIKHLSYHQILNNNTPEDTIYNNMLEWRQAIKAPSL